MCSRPVIGEIWRRDTDGVASLVDLIDEVPLELDDVTRAEGLRHLTPIVHMGVFTTHDLRPDGHVGNWMCTTGASERRAHWLLIRPCSSRIDDAESADEMLQESLDLDRRRLGHFIRSGVNFVTT